MLTPFFKSNFTDTDALDIVDSLFRGCAQSSDSVPDSFYDEDESGVIISVDLPGCSKENIDINVDHGSVKVYASRTIRKKKVSYSQTFRVRKDYDTDGAKVRSYENGVLTIVVPKKEKDNSVRKLVIE